MCYTRANCRVTGLLKRNLLEEDTVQEILQKVICKKSKASCHASSGGYGPQRIGTAGETASGIVPAGSSGGSDFLREVFRISG